MISVKTAFFTGIFAVCVPVFVMATEKPPAEGKKIGQIVEALESRGYDTVTEVEYDDGQWEAEVYKDGEKRKVTLDATTAEILAED